jgi:hypothetical protein
VALHNWVWRWRFVMMILIGVNVGLSGPRHRVMTSFHADCGTNCFTCALDPARPVNDCLTVLRGRYCRRLSYCCLAYLMLI